MDGCCWCQQAADKEALKSDVRAFLKLDASKEFVVSTAEWLGLFEEEPIPAKVRPRKLCSSSTLARSTTN